MTKDYWRISISGDVSEIPTRLPHKQAEPRRQIKDVLRTGLTLEALGEGDYFGFELEGADRLFLLGDFTVTHNTNIGAQMMKDSTDKGASKVGDNCQFLVHRRELLKQTAKTVERFDIDYGIVGAGFPFQPHRPVTIGSVATVVRRLELLPPPKLIIVDEAHHASAGMWQTILTHWPRAFVVGLSATPERLDGKGLDNIFNAMVHGPETGWLIDEGYLAPFRAWSHPNIPNADEIRKIGGDFAHDELEEMMSKPHLVGDVVNHYLEHANGTQAVAFCVSIKHAKLMAEMFRDAGVACMEIDGETPTHERDRIMDAFRSGEIKVLTSVDLISEGFDLPEMRTVIMCRPTASLGLYMQQIGRCLRPVYANGWILNTTAERLAAIAAGEKPFAIVLDHAGNIARHGLPTVRREWSLQGRKKVGGKKPPPQKQCPNCFGTLPAAQRICEHCGYEFEVNARQLVEIDGKLQEITLEEMIRMQAEATFKKNREVKYAELKKIQATRGYKRGWIWHQINSWAERERERLGL